MAASVLPSAVAWSAGAGTVAFYVAFTTALQVAYYRRRASEVPSWKVQPHELSWKAARSVWWLPALDWLASPSSSSTSSSPSPSPASPSSSSTSPTSSTATAIKPGRHPDHALFATVNLLLAGAFMVAAVELTARGATGVLFDWDEAGGWAGVAAGALMAIVYENVTEYVWHRVMHTRFFYTTMHKIHHYYKAPTPFDDMFVHPLEVTGYYMILYGPVYLFRLHWASLLVYAGVMGITGMLDHSGIRLAIPGIYNTADHDTHHALYAWNFGFPFPFVDQLLGTYRAPEAVPVPQSRSPRRSKVA